MKCVAAAENYVTLKTYCLQINGRFLQTVAFYTMYGAFFKGHGKKTSYSSSCPSNTPAVCPEEDVTADYGCPISFATTVDFLDRLQQQGHKILIQTHKQ